MMDCYMILLVFLAVSVTKVCAQCTVTDQPLTVIPSGIPQYVTSPNYGGGNNYPGQSNCHWLINATSNDERIIINVNEAKFRSGDYVTIYDGDSNEAPQLAHGEDTATDLLNEYVSNGSALYIQFYSDTNMNDDGFEILVFVADSAAFQPCSQILNATLTTQYLMSDTLPGTYNDDINCITYIQAVDQYYTLRYRIYFLDMEEVAGCTNDKLEILEGLDANNLSSLHSACSTAQTYAFSDIDSVYSFGAINVTTNDANNSYMGFFLSFVEVFQGINLTYPTDDDMTFFNVTEDATGAIDTATAKVTVTSTGPSGFTMTIFNDGIEITVFGLSPDKSVADSYNLEITGSLDYENTTFYNLTVLIVDSTYTALSASARFEINVTDIDDNAPLFTNLPNNVTVYRTRGTGYQVMTVSTTDADISAEFRQTEYSITSGDTSGLLSISNTTGEITLAMPVSSLAATITSYTVVIAAYSGSMLSSTATLQLVIPLDGPPVCSHVTAYSNDLNTNEVSAGTAIEFADQWNCTDEYVTSYSIGTVTPTLSTPLFSISNSTGEITALRSFAISEVPNRQFNVSVIATDTLTQTTTFYVVVNISALLCYPKPRQIYVRMDSPVGTVIIRDYNCTSSNLVYTITSQYPAQTFSLSDSSLILQATVYKIRFYSMTMEITDGVDTEVVDFKVTVRMKQCKITINSTVVASPSMSLLVGMFLLCIGAYQRYQDVNGDI